MAASQGLSKSTISNIWRSHNIKPHRTRTFKLSATPRLSPTAGGTAYHSYHSSQYLSLELPTLPRIRLVDTSYYADYGATSFPNAFPAGAAAPPPTRVARASYTGSHTTNLIYKPDLNQVAPKTIGYAALVATPSLRAANLKYPNFRKVLTRDNGPSDKYNALTAELNRRFSSDLTLSNHYT